MEGLLAEPAASPDSAPRRGPPPGQVAAPAWLATAVPIAARVAAPVSPLR